jgi:hypothetical protein
MEGDSDVYELPCRHRFTRQQMEASTPVNGRIACSECGDTCATNEELKRILADCCICYASPWTSSDPKFVTTPCGHSICKTCLVAMCAAITNEITCTNCGQFHGQIQLLCDGCNWPLLRKDLLRCAVCRESIGVAWVQNATNFKKTDRAVYDLMHPLLQTDVDTAYFTPAMTIIIQDVIIAAKFACVPVVFFGLVIILGVLALFVGNGPGPALKPNIFA